MKGIHITAVTQPGGSSSITSDTANKKKRIYYETSSFLEDGLVVIPKGTIAFLERDDQTREEYEQSLIDQLVRAEADGMSEGMNIAYVRLRPIKISVRGEAEGSLMLHLYQPLFKMKDKVK